MPVGDCERTFPAAAARDGIVLERAREAWLNQRGHLGLPDEAPDARNVLVDIFKVLGGLPEEQASTRLTPLPGDFRHPASGTLIEVDESQHFTSFRLATLNRYPADVPVGFDLDEYQALCHEWAPRSDRYRGAKAAVGFGDGGRQRQRAYHDALRDLAAPATGRPPVNRVPAPDRDGEAAYERMRDRIVALRGT